MKDCWICGATATSREHIVKASDLKMILGKNPEQILLNTDVAKNKKIQSINSQSMKYPPSICETCNTTRTQLNDRAWETFSAYLYKKTPRIKKNDLLNLSSIFNGNASTGLRNIHLYFVKLFGCLIAYTEAPIDLVPFRDAVINQTCHPDVWIEIVESQQSESFAQVGRSPLNLVAAGDETHAANWIYHLHRFTVLVSYLPYGRRMPQGHYPIHPQHPKKLVRVGRL